ncbi:MFS monocarboxylate [Mycena indigotica]|uniref:MFS monocarboxylate n=1 Tax=Mycena indigotica TaxID=2126181 RepID=A0A8H6WBH6_9AGAR|nr:MFS monocarboxylate [Mycena indigotica]KAF7312629.1 MFS monocarboxylate [Mycena indigotica]
MGSTQTYTHNLGHERKESAATIAVNVDTSSKEVGGEGPKPEAGEEVEEGGEKEFPDGGLRAWGTVFGAFMINFSCYGVVTSFGVFEQYYSTHQLSTSPLSAIAWIGSLQLALVLLMGCVSGPLFDAGYLKPMIAGAGTFYVFCLFMTSLATEFYQFVLAQGLGVGICMGLLYSPAMSTIGHHFAPHGRKIVAFGVFSTGASIGGALVPIAMRRLLESVGFAWAMRTLAFLVMFSILCGFLFCNTRLPPRNGSRVLDFTFGTVHTASLFLGRHSSAWVSMHQLAMALRMPLPRGVDQSTAFYSLSLLNALSIPGRLLPNLLAQRLAGPLNTLIACCILTGALDIVWPFVRAGPGGAGVLGFNAAFGLASGGYVSMLAPAITSLDDSHGSNTHQQLKKGQTTGVKLGMAFFVTSFCWLASAPVQGALIRRRPGGTDEYWPAGVFSGAMVLLGVAMIGVARWIVGRRMGRWDV